MNRNYRGCEGRSMRISVQKYNEQHGAREQQRRQAQRENDLQRRDQSAASLPVSASIVENAASSVSGHGDWEEKIPSYNVLIPRNRQPAGAPRDAPEPSRPSGGFRENKNAQQQTNSQNRHQDPVAAAEAASGVVFREHEAPVTAPAVVSENAKSPSSQHEKWNENIPSYNVLIPRKRQPARAPRDNPEPSRPWGGFRGNRNAQHTNSRNRPAAAAAAAAAVESAFREHEESRPYHRNHRSGRGENSSRPRPECRQGRDFPRKDSEDYYVELPARLLPGRDEKALERLNGVDLPQDVDLVAKEGRPFPCSRELLSNMCFCFDVSSGWSFPKLELNADQNVTGRIADFVVNGSITIDDHNIADIMEAADFLGFESLLKICVDYVSRQAFPTNCIVELDARFHHVDGMPAAFTEKLDKMPLDLFHSKKEPDSSLLLSLSFEQLKRVLASDRLQVTHEDQTVQMMVQWFEHNEVSEEKKKSCLGLVRYPFISKSMQESLKKGTLGLPPVSVVDEVRSESGCCERAGYDKHVHILWCEQRGSLQGAENLSVTCVTWNKYLRKVNERTLLRVPIKPTRDAEARSVQYAVAGNKLVTAAFHRSRRSILVDEVDLTRGASTRTRTIPLTRESPCQRPDATIVKGCPDLTISYAREPDTEIIWYNTETWREKHRRSLGNYPINPSELQIFDDMAIAINLGTVVISKPDFTDPFTVEHPLREGYFVDFERVGDDLLILEDCAKNRVVHNIHDLIIVIDLKKKVVKESIELPIHFEANKHRDTYTRVPVSYTRFLRINSEIFVVSQTDIDMHVRIISFDLRTHRTEVVCLLRPPRPNVDDPESVCSRGFLCAVPFRMIPCDRSSPRDLS